MAVKAKQQYYADNVTLKKEAREFGMIDELKEKLDSVEWGAQVNVIEEVQENGVPLEIVDKTVNVLVPEVIDNLYTIDPNNSLSAKQGKILYDMIKNLLSRGRFLSTWNTATGLPLTNPEESPYPYKAGDYYIVGVTAQEGGTNFRPKPVEYVINVASDEQETSEVHVSDIYVYDGEKWILLINSTRELAVDDYVDYTYQSTNPVENQAIARELAKKQNIFHYIGNTAPTPQNEGDEWYDTANDKLKVWDGTQWNEMGGGGSTYTAGLHITIDPNDNNKISVVEWSATASSLGLVKLGSDTVQSTSPNNVTSTTGRTYRIQANGSGQLMVNVPWTDTTYSAGTGISISNNRVISCTVKPVTVGPTAPATPGTGDLWYDTNKNTMFLYKNNAWTIIGPEIYPITKADYDALTPAEQGDGRFFLITDNDGTIYVDWDNVQNRPMYIGTTAPTNPCEGYIWYDTTNDVLKIYNGTQWNEVGGGGTTYTAGNGISISNNEISVDTTVVATKTDLSSKQDTISDLATIRSGASAGATAIQPNDNVSELTNDAGYITSSALDNYSTTTEMNNAISTATSGLATESYVDTALSSKQDTLTAGANITIAQDGTISAIDTTYTAGDGINITSGEISVDASDIAGTGLTVSNNNLDVDSTIVALKSDLSNYYAKTETYTKTEVDNLIANVGSFEVVATLPSADTADTKKIYLLGPIGTGADKYEEYIVTESEGVKSWTKIGETSVDLSGYATISAMNAALLTKADASDLNTKTFTLSSTSDLTTAQAAYDWYAAGKNPIIIYNSIAYILAGVSTGRLKFAQAEHGVAPYGSYTKDAYLTVSINHSSGTVSSVTVGLDEVTSYLDTNTNYSTPYTPTYDGSPTTKKYVDDRDTYIGTSEPTSNKVEGRLWYDTTNDVLKVYDGTNWNATGKAYTAGDGIDIDANNEISVDVTDIIGTGLTEDASNNITIDTTVVATQTDLSGKQDKATSGSTAPSTTPSYIGQQYIDTTADKMYVATGTSSSSDWTEVGAGSGDMLYSDFGWETLTGANVTLALRGEIEPSANFTVNKPNDLKDGQFYILRVITGATAYTMTLGTDVTNPYSEDLTLSANTIANFTFLAKGGNLELQPSTEIDISGKQDKATSGSTAPSTTPSYIGQQYVDTTNNILYVAKGTSSSSDWIVAGKTYTAGTNISIDANNVISATDTTYTAGDGIDITNNIISADLVAGTGINLSGGTCVTESDRKGPCPSGFHVPALTEWQGLKTIMTSVSGSGASYWISNLHMPLAGARYSANGGRISYGMRGNYQSSTPYRSLALVSGVVDDSHGNSESEGYSIRAFKNEFVVPDSSWTVVNGTLGNAGIFWDQTNGLISITSNGTTGYTIQDKNLGATVVYNDGDTLTAANCGNLYQWGNNYGFSWDGTLTTSSTKVDASDYGPGNYYSSSTFITTESGDNSWSSVRNDNLWGNTSNSTHQECVYAPITISSTVNGFNPSNAGTEGQVLTKTSTGYNWADVQGGGGNVIAMTQAEYNALTTEEKNDGKLRIITDAPTEDISVDWANIANKPIELSTQSGNTLTSLKIWVGGQTDYEALATKDASTLYFTTNVVS